jgi:hypothetical protein
MNSNIRSPGDKLFFLSQLAAKSSKQKFQRREF